MGLTNANGELSVSAVLKAGLLLVSGALAGGSGLQVWHSQQPLKACFCQTAELQSRIDHFYELLLLHNEQRK